MTENNLKQNNSRCEDRADVLRSLQKKIILRASLIVVTITLTAILLFTLTAAWYNNVTGGGGLTFSAKQWNFNGTIIVGDNAIEMAPGDSGIISMQIKNDGQEVAAASVTVSKDTFDELMSQRVYFYVDTPYYRNGEKMDRVYISSNSGYAYTIFPGGEIIITGERQNAPALKWEWVYDVLGYYVLGTISEVPVSGDNGESDTGSTEISVEIKEYIRPIEYNYDPILTVFNEDGTLKYVDGVQTADEFMVNLSKTDGYIGTIVPQNKTANGYYPVYVNSEGYGIWAYLCTKEELAENSAKDTEIGQTIPLPAFSATVTVTGSNTKDTAFEVGDGSTFISLVENSNYANLKLTSSIVLDSTVTVPSGGRVYIDLNGYTISGPQDPLGGKALIETEPYSKLTVVNGILDGNGTTYGFEVVGSELEINDVTIIDVTEGIKVSDHFNVQNVETRVAIVDCHIMGSDDAVWLYDLHGENNARTTVIIENSKLIGMNYAGVLCSGNHNNTDIQINKSTIKGFYTAIYHPQKDSVMTISNSSLEGNTGLVVKGGVVNIVDSQIRGIQNIHEPPEDVMSGFATTGDGIYLEGSSNYTWSAVVNVSGDKTVVTSTAADTVAIRLFVGANASAVKQINVMGGKFNTDVSEFLVNGATQTKVDETEYVVTLPEEPEKADEALDAETSDGDETESPEEKIDQSIS